MKREVIAIDLDGTLLNQDSQLSNYTIETVKRVCQAGHLIFIVTGRPYRMAKEFYQQLGLETPMINYNGSLVHLPGKTWDKEYSRPIEQTYLRQFLAKAQDFQTDFIAAEYKEDFQITLTHPERIDPALLGVTQISPDKSLLAETIQANPYSILLQTHAQDKYALADLMREYFQNQLEINTWGGPLNILETCAKGVTKGTALTHLLECYGIDSKKLIAFGDEQNDVSMFQVAGTSYAMKNANSILLPYASHYLPWTNQEDGVARKLEELFL